MTKKKVKAKYSPEEMEAQRAEFTPPDFYLFETLGKLWYEITKSGVLNLKEVSEKIQQESESLESKVRRYRIARRAQHYLKKISGKSVDPIETAYLRGRYDQAICDLQLGDRRPQPKKIRKKNATSQSSSKRRTDFRKDQGVQ